VFYSQVIVEEKVGWFGSRYWCGWQDFDICNDLRQSRLQT
jgi:hypothetical protein